MKPQNRRDLLRELMTLLATPLTLGATMLIGRTSSDRTMLRDRPPVATNKNTRAMNTAAPNRSVVRRG
jgi:hypothetical protein